MIKNGMKGMRRGSDLCDLPAFNKKGHSLLQTLNTNSVLVSLCVHNLFQEGSHSLFLVERIIHTYSLCSGKNSFIPLIKIPPCQRNWEIKFGL